MLKFLNLASDLLKELHSPQNKFRKEAVLKYYKNTNLDENRFSFRPTMQASLLKLLEEVDPSKSVGIDDYAKDG